MDDLLALMDGTAVPGDDATQRQNSQGDREPRNAPVNTNHSETSFEDLFVNSSSSNTNRGSRGHAVGTPSIQASSSYAAARPKPSIDDKIGIRIINRRISSLDWMDVLASCPYHSAAQLSAMSRNSLASILERPSPKEDVVSGKAKICTVGIVFHNSGTKISANGRAYALLKLGNLQTGPAVSVFLFGHAYSAHAKLVKGSVVTLLSPSILPPKGGGGDTSLSLSVNDDKQLLVVGTARDYGICKGTSQFHRNGKVEQVPCKHFVDTSVVKYCPKHRKQQFAKSGQEMTYVQKMKAERGVSLVQKMKAEAAPRAKAHGSAVEIYQQRSQRRATGAVASGNKARTTIPGPAPTGTSKGNRLNVPLHMKMKQSSRGRPTQPTRPGQGISVLKRKRSETAGSDFLARMISGEKTMQKVCTATASVGRNALKKQVLNRRSINTDAPGFDGAVQVPQPRKTLFRTSNNVDDVRRPVSSEESRALTELKKQNVLENQRKLAGAISVGKSAAGVASKGCIATGGESNPQRSQKQTKDDSLFDGFKGIDIEKVHAAKSRFSSEANAEEYARSRRIVSELERKETALEKQAARLQRKNGNEEKAIQHEYVCEECKRRSSARPMACVRKGHKVRALRQLKEVTNLREQRLQRQSKNVEDGGIVLGSGLEWSARGNS